MPIQHPHRKCCAGNQSISSAMCRASRHALRDEGRMPVSTANQRLLICKTPPVVAGELLPSPAPEARDGGWGG
eukprot:16354869-Heterocapsa_arctica.AAC.1